MTSHLHVPVFRPADFGSPSESRRSWRRSPARDSRCVCPNFSMISSIASAACPDRPVSDICGLSPADTRSRWWRSRSPSRAADGFSARRFLSRLARRRSRHFTLQVICVSEADGSGAYQSRHSQQRRRNVLLGSIPQRDRAEQLPRLLRRYCGAGVRARDWIPQPPQDGSQSGRRQSTLVQRVLECGKFATNGLLVVRSRFAAEMTLEFCRAHSGRGQKCGERLEFAHP